MTSGIYVAQRGAIFLIAVKHWRRKALQLIRDRLTFGRRIPWHTSKWEIKRGHDNMTWDLRVMFEPQWVVEQWPVRAKIIAVGNHDIREDKTQVESRYYISS